MNSKYTVFIDESFYEFMNLARDDGNFCYAALMVPTDKLPDLDRFWSANREKLASAYTKTTGHKPMQEFKSGMLSKLAFEVRKTFGERLARFLVRNQCHVAGFYTTVRNSLLYRVRTEVAKDDDARELPLNLVSLVAAEKVKVLEDKPNHPGEAHVLEPLFSQTLGITWYWLKQLRQNFAVVYDPRQEKENLYLIRHADAWLRRLEKAEQMDDFYRGTTTILRSHESPGLMLVDIIVRDVRALFRDVPELLIEQSGPGLVLPCAQEHDIVLMEFGGDLMKWGDRRPMSGTLKHRLICPTANSMLPLYFKSLADGKLSCIAAFGESRVVNFGLMAFENQVD